MPGYQDDRLKVLVRKDRRVGGWIISPRSFGYHPVRAGSFERALVIANAYAIEIRRLAA